MSFAIPLPHYRTRRESAPHTTQEPIKRTIALDPVFAKQVETVLPLDQGVGKVAAVAIEAYGVQEFMNRGVDPNTAKRRTEKIAAELPGLGNFVSNNVPEEQRTRFEEAAAPHDLAAQVTLGAMFMLASRQPDSYYGSQAASFVSDIDQTQAQTHVRLG